MNMRRPFTAGLVAGALAWSASLSGCGTPVEAPKSYKEFLSKDGAFSCQYPAGWDTEGGAGQSMYSWAKFNQGDAQIRVDADLAGSLFADMAKSRDADAEPPVARVHPMKIKATSEEFTNYKEREPETFQSKGLGEGRRSYFIADGALGAKLAGYRATLLSNDKRITVLCQCRTRDWKTLKPAFLHVIDSLGR